jgi:hypothetical protein
LCSFLFIRAIPSKESLDDVFLAMRISALHAPRRASPLNSWITGKKIFDIFVNAARRVDATVDEMGVEGSDWKKCKPGGQKKRRLRKCDRCMAPANAETAGLIDQPRSTQHYDSPFINLDGFKRLSEMRNGAVHE